MSISVRRFLDERHEGTEARRHEVKAAGAFPSVPSCLRAFVPFSSMSLTALLDQTLTLQRQTVTADNSGGSVRTFAAILNNLRLAVAPARASDVTDYARRDMIVDYTVYTTADLDTLVPGGVALGDRLTDGTVYYLIKDVKKARMRRSRRNCCINSIVNAA